MERDEIIEKFKEVTNGAIIVTESNDVSILKCSHGLKMKTCFGWFIYTPEELADEILGWTEEIINIEVI